MGANERDTIIEFLLDWDIEKAGKLSRYELLATIELLLSEAYWAETDEYLTWLYNERKGV